MHAKQISLVVKLLPLCLQHLLINLHTNHESQRDRPIPININRKFSTTNKNNTQRSGHLTIKIPNTEIKSQTRFIFRHH